MKKENGVSGMTTDAKIGLLLGLVFIVIIAFVIHGLPSFHRTAETNDWTAKYVSQVGNKQIGLTGAPMDSINTVNPGQADAERLNNGSIENQNALPQANAVIQITPAAAAETNTVAIAAPGADPQVTQSANTAIAQTVQATTPPIQQQSKPASTTYTIRKGDTLASIAAKFYGSSESKKKSTIDRLMKENHLKNTRQLSVGQKLVIPAPEKMLDSAQPGLFERVEKISRQTLGIQSTPQEPQQITTPTPANSGAPGEYVVQQGDYLWKIAAKQLGNGNRYAEIINANPDKLKTKDSPLSVGMRLKMPSR